jgi:hypothetical protein
VDLRQTRNGQIDIIGDRKGGGCWLAGLVFGRRLTTPVTQVIYHFSRRRFVVVYFDVEKVDSGNEEQREIFNGWSWSLSGWFSLPLFFFYFSIVFVGSVSQHRVLDI